MENIGYRSSSGLVRRYFWRIACVVVVRLLATAYLGHGTIKQILLLARIHRARLFILAVSPAQSVPGIRSEVQFLQDLSGFCGKIQKRSEGFSGDLRPLVKEISDRQASGKNVAYSMQIYREIRWWANFTSDEAATRHRIAELKQSLATDADQRFAEEQQPDGSWGAGYNVWFMKLFGTANEGLAKGKQPKYPLSFLDRINSPGQLTNYLWSVVRNDFLKTGVINRMEADESTSILGRLILGDVPCEFGVYFLRDVGFFEKQRRFWTDRDFPHAAAVRGKIKARIQATEVNSPELKDSLDSLGAP